MAGAVPATAQSVAVQETPDFRGPPFAMQGGEAVYGGVCQGCHMADAKGATGAGMYPALASNAKLASAGYGARFWSLAARWSTRCDRSRT